MKIIAYDLGTGGVKASLYDSELNTLAKSFIEYNTIYPAPNVHEQRPLDWWDGVIRSTKVLLETSSTSGSEIGALALSGHSLVTVPVDSSGNLLLDRVPIWSDTTAAEEARDFFRRIDPDRWYMETGNGFPAACYSLFKLNHLKNTDPALFSKIYKVLGSKDYINYKLTGEMATDHSYASGCGGYSLERHDLVLDFFGAAELNPAIFPEIVPSHTMIGKICAAAAAETGLPTGIPVACGGVDNACMALGAVGAEEGKVYLSLGSSSWIPVNSSTPILDSVKKPYVFAHIAEGLYTSAFSIFSGGSSLKWVRDVLCGDIAGEPDAFAKMDALAAASAPGTGGVFFNPSLAGGTSQDKSPNIRGGYIGLSLGTTKEDLIRAAMEGIAMNLKMSYDFLMEKTEPTGGLLICGGGSKSKFWLQLFADIFGVDIIKTNIDQDAASIGAAAIAARACGLWNDYSGIGALHKTELICNPDPNLTALYGKLLSEFAYLSEVLSDAGDHMKNLRT
ncbi:pentose kinase [Clostridia bacterium]|nr:pentose kinase [Clostridia bacterium]